MLNKVLALLIILLFLNHKNKIMEGTMDSNKRSICENNSDLKLFMVDQRCGSSTEPTTIKNCIGSNDKFSIRDDCKLCNDGNYGKCKPTFKGGFCDNNGEKTDGYGETLRNTGRDLSNMDEEEIISYDEDKYNEIKNQCNPFYSNEETDREDDNYDRRDREEDSLYENEEENEEDAIDRNYRHRNKIQKVREERRKLQQENSYSISDIFLFLLSFLGILFVLLLICLIIITIFSGQISKLTNYDLSYFKSIKQQIFKQSTNINK